jgi:Apolipoprotein O
MPLLNSVLGSVGVAVLGASIVTRNRELSLGGWFRSFFTSDAVAGSVLVRWLTPPLFMVATASYFLPKTTDNIRNYTFAVEEAHLPALAAQHRRVYEATASAWNSIRARTSGSLSGSVDEWTKKVQGLTGLKVHEATKTKPQGDQE